MKTLRKFIFAVVALLPLLALGAAGDTKISQKNSSDTAWIDRIFADGPAGYILETNGSGTGFSWVAQPTGTIPSQTGKTNNILTTNGTSASWTLTPSGLTSIGVNSITAASATDFTANGGSGGATLKIAKGTGDGTSPVSTLTSVFAIGGGTGTYVDYLLTLTGWAANTRDAGIGLTSATGGGSPLVDFINGDTPSGKGRIGRNPSTGISALFVGTGGDTPSGFQIGTRDGTAVQLFTNDSSRVFITSAGNVGIGAFTNLSQPDTLFHVLGSAKITSSLTVASITASGAINESGSLNLITGGQTNLVAQAAGNDAYFDAPSLPNGSIFIRTLGSGSVVIKGQNNTAATFTGSNTTLAGNLTVSGTGTSSFAGAVSIGTAGNTLSVKSGSNAAAGTVTLIAGTAAISSTAIDANTVIIFSEKTAGGTPGLYQPLAAVSAGNATVTSAVTDTSTYNWVALKVN